MFPIVLPSAPTTIVGTKRSDDVEIAYPQIAYKNCEDGKFMMPFVSMRRKIAMYEKLLMRKCRSITTVYRR
jgi:hypothetical protein